MRRVSWNEDWEFRASRNRFQEMYGDNEAWTPVTLPHDAMLGTDRSPDGTPGAAFFPRGAWEYRRNFTPDAAHGDSVVLLEFEGAYRDAVVMINGTVAGRRAYGYSNFVVAIDHLLRFGERNEVRVEVRTGDDSRWYSGAGLHRNVWMLDAGPIHFTPDRLEVQTTELDDDVAVVAVVCQIRSRLQVPSELAVRTEIRDAEGELLTSADTPVTTYPQDAVTSRQRLVIRDARRWGPDHPNLYQCRVLLLDGDVVVDENSSTFGLRTLSLDPRRGLRLNGEPVLLRGACVHHDNGPIGAAAIDRADERRVELLRAAGFNAIRSAHNPMSRAMLDACDRLGMLVMDETFDMWLQTKSTDDYALRFDDWWEADVEAMVRKDINHPCVVMYSIGNEIPEGSTTAGLRVGRALAEKVRDLDPSRFVTQAVSGLLAAGAEAFMEFRAEAEAAGTNEETGINTALTNLADIMPKMIRSRAVDRKISESFSYVDVAGYNYMDDRFDLDGDLHPERVIVSTEGHGPTIDIAWQRVEANPHVIGDFTWTGWDYIGEVGVGRIEYGEADAAPSFESFMGEYPWRTAWCADIDITGRRRPQSYFREIVFGLSVGPVIAVQPPEHHGRPVGHSSPWAFDDVELTWSWAGHEGAPVSVSVFADADEVELFVNDRSLGRKPAGAEERFRAVFTCTYEPGILEAVARKGGGEIGRSTLRSAASEVRIALTPDRTEIAAKSSDLAFVDIALVDDSGEVHATADRSVHITVTGPGALQGLGSANPRSEERFTDEDCTTFRGRAIAVIRPIGSGTITVTASAPGCDAATSAVEAH